MRDLIRNASDRFDERKNEWTFTANLFSTSIGVASGIWLAASLALSWLLRTPFLLFAVPLAAATGWGWWRFINRLAEEAMQEQKDKHVRGSRLISQEELQRQLVEIEQSEVKSYASALSEATGMPLEDAQKRIDKDRARLVDINFGGIQMPVDSETNGVLFVGSSGSGKSVALRRWIKAMVEGGHKLMILDPKPELIEEFWQPDSVLLNPFDARCAKWDFWAEIKELPDYRAVAEGVFPASSKADPFTDGARNIFAGLLELASSNAELNELLSMDEELLQAKFQNTMAAGAINANNSRGTGAFLQKMRAELQVLRYPEPAGWVTAPTFSITDWIRNDDDKRLVFLSFDNAHLPALRRMLTLWIDIAIRRLLSMPEARKADRPKQRRVGFVLEELPALEAPVPLFQQLTSLGRSFGSCYALVMQNPPQLGEIYGEGVADSILANTRTWMMFATGSKDAAEYMSQKLGDVEVLRKSNSVSMGVEAARDGKGRSESKVITPIVLPSEIMGLPDNLSYISIRGPYGKAKVRTMPLHLPKVAPAKVARTDLLAKQRALMPKAIADGGDASPETIAGKPTGKRTKKATPAVPDAVAALAGVTGVWAEAEAAETLTAAQQAENDEWAEKLTFGKPDEDGVIIPVEDLPSTEGSLDDLSNEQLLAQLG